MIYVVFTIVFFVLMLTYFRIAEKFNIVDKPNERSSHSKITIRGGGILFVISVIGAGLMFPLYWLPVVGTVIIGITSFLDDQITLSSRIRFLVQIISVTILFYYLQIFSNFSWWELGALYILVIGIINAYNFMDGINGITGAYSFVVLGGLQYVNLKQVSFINEDMIWLPMIACVVFLFFNFRKKARCFAGDVGSVSIAFWIIMLLLQLILLTHNWIYILFLAVYGVDSVFTIIHRLTLRQNIFEAHRLHFYQLLANEGKMPHLMVSSIYAFSQLLIILCIIFNPDRVWLNIVVCLVPLIFLYLILKPGLMKLKSST
jgi:UDP-N-acetylmuramyl pentapeptide phosphotransferase/UDP-N-acetylglucosamine-1-phosphate transferase